MFSNKKILITGGSSGIGKQLAADFLRRGSHVTILADEAKKLEVARRELSVISPSLSALLCDVAALDQVRAASASYIQQFGAPDILISNAGFAVYRTFDEMPSEEISRLLSVNFVGACLITREFMPAMLAAGRGSIVVMASIAGRLAMTPCGVYSAAKHGLVAWARTLRMELAFTDVRVHVICPGRVETDFFSHPSFAARAPRRETQHTIPIEAVSRAVMRAVEKNSFMVFIPRSYGILVWLANAFPFPVETLLNRLMRARVKTIRTEKENPIDA